MDLKEFKKLINSIPDKFNEYDIIYSITEQLEKSDKLYKDYWTRTDYGIHGIISDDIHEQICILDSHSSELVKNK